MRSNTVRSNTVMKRRRVGGSSYTPILRGCKLYCYHSSHDHKSSARAEAGRLRKAGYLAMVRVMKRTYGTFWAVYSC